VRGGIGGQAQQRAGRRLGQIWLDAHRRRVTPEPRGREGGRDFPGRRTLGLVQADARSSRQRMASPRPTGPALQRGSWCGCGAPGQRKPRLNPLEGGHRY
jgi:hypothetical protein